MTPQPMQDTANSATMKTDFASAALTPPVQRAVNAGPVNAPPTGPAPFSLTHDPLTGLLIEPQPRKLARHIIAEVAQAYRISVNEILSCGRRHPVAKARMEAMRRIRLELNYSYHQIARIFDRDHSTVISAVRGGKGGLDKRNKQKQVAA